jgi:alkylation response protein AidB-like acyl-CoA dehydrogenase
VTWETPEEFDLLVKGVRQFVQRELEPAAEAIGRDGKVPERMLTELQRAGYFGLTIPSQYGGAGLGVIAYCLVQEELAQTHSCFGTLIAGNKRSEHVWQEHREADPCPARQARAGRPRPGREGGGPGAA